MLDSEAGSSRLLCFTPGAAKDRRLQIIPLDGQAVVSAAADPEELTEAQTQKALALIQQLAASGFADREKAHNELISMGRAILPLIENAKASDDAEIALRAGHIARKIKGEPKPGAAPPAAHARTRLHLVSTIGDHLLSLGRKAPEDQDYQGLVLDMRTNRLVGRTGNSIVLDREGSTALVCDLAKREVWVATIESGP